MTVGVARPLRLAFLAGGAACTAMGGAPAAAQQRGIEVRVSADAGIESNPFLSDDDGGGVTATAGIRVEPSVFIVDERSNFRLRGSISLREFDGAPTNEAAALSAGGGTRIDERTSLSGDVSFITSRNAAQDLLRTGTNDLLAGIASPAPATPFDDTAATPGGDFAQDFIDPDFPIVDPTVAGTPLRTTSIGARAALTRQLSERNAITIGIDAQESSIEGDRGNDFRRAGAVLNWARRLSERTSLQTSVAVSKNDLVGQEFGDGITITPLIGVAQQVSERLTWSARAGATFTEIDDGRGGTVNSTDLAFSAQLCDRGEMSNLCFSAARDARPTIFGGLTTSTSLAARYSHQLTQRDRVDLGVSYQRSEQILDEELIEDFGEMGFDDTFELVGANVGYSRELGDRLFGFADVAYADTFGGNRGREGNFRAVVGLTYVFGTRR
jgi:hypothetical protein